MISLCKKKQDKTAISCNCYC